MEPIFNLFWNFVPIVFSVLVFLFLVFLFMYCIKKVIYWIKHL